MINGIKLAPSVLAADYARLGEQVQEVAAAGADYIHVDVMDGRFVPNITVGPLVVEALRRMTDLPLDVHLMVEEPKRIFELIPPQEGARVSIHYEACRNLHRELVKLRQLGFSPGLVVNPATTLDHIDYVVEEVNLVTIMTVNPGAPSQRIVPQVLKKIERLKEWRDRAGYQLDIVVDGNVSFDNIPKMVAAGADMLVLGRSLDIDV